MFKKREENKQYSEENLLLIKYLDLQTDEYIAKFIKSKYKEGQYVNVASTGTAGGLRVKIIHDRVDIHRLEKYTKIYIGTAKVWDNEITDSGKFKGKSRLAKIVL
jgi:hypothetical protein